MKNYNQLATEELAKNNRICVGLEIATVVIVVCLITVGTAVACCPRHTWCGYAPAVIVEQPCQPCPPRYELREVWIQPPPRYELREVLVQQRPRYELRRVLVQP